MLDIDKEQLLENHQCKSTRGFASMDQQKQREIASKGGKAAHAKGTAHQFDSQEAREAGKKGGRVAHTRGTAHEFDSQEAKEAGRKGGQSRNRASEDTVEHSGQASQTFIEHSFSAT